MSISKEVTFSIVEKWDKVQGKAYLFRLKNSGEVICYGKYKKGVSQSEYYKENFAQIKSKVSGNNSVSGIKSKQDKVKTYRIASKYTHYNIVQTNKIISGYNVQAIARVYNSETNEEFNIWSSHYPVTHGKMEMYKVFQELVSKIKEYEGKLQVKDWTFQYWIPNDVDLDEMMSGGLEKYNLN